MANKTCTVSIQLSYTGPSGEAVTLPKRSVSCPYQASIAGTIDIPDTTAPSTEFEVPFGAVDVDATCVVIENFTQQDLKVTINGDGPSHVIAPGGAEVIANPASASCHKITEVKLTTSATQEGVGLVAYRLFGDPT